MPEAIFQLNAPSAGALIAALLLHHIKSQAKLIITIRMDGPDLPRDADALDYASRIIRELKQGGGYDDPGTVMIVKDKAQRVVLSIPF